MPIVHVLLPVAEALANASEATPKLACDAELAAKKTEVMPAGCVIVLVPVAPAKKPHSRVSLTLPVDGVIDGDVLVPLVFCVVATEPSRLLGPAPFQAVNSQWPLVAVVVQLTDWLTEAVGAGAILVKIAVTTVAPEPLAVVAREVVHPVAVIPLGALAPPTDMMITISAPAGTLPVLLTVTLVPEVKLPLLLLAEMLVGWVGIV